MQPTDDSHTGCLECARFLDDPRALERCFPGLRALSSAFGASRGRAGICTAEGRFMDPQAACAGFVPRIPGEPHLPGYVGVTGWGKAPRGRVVARPEPEPARPLLRDGDEVPKRCP